MPLPQVGCCERILRQPIPPGYSRHTQRFLIVFLTFLPVGELISCTAVFSLLFPYLFFLHGGGCKLHLQGSPGPASPEAAKACSPCPCASP